VLRVCLLLAIYASLVMSITAYQTADTVNHANEPNPNGILALANFVNSQPLGIIIYDHWLGWQMGYYMGAWTDKRRVYYATPEIQAADALLNPDPAPRYLIAPEGENALIWVKMMEKQGFSTGLSDQDSGVVAYRLIPPWASPDGASAESS